MHGLDGKKMIEYNLYIHVIGFLAHTYSLAVFQQDSQKNTCDDITI